VKRLLIAAVVLVFLVFGLWIIAVPESLLTNLVEGAMHDGNLRLRVSEMHKGLFYDFSCGSITLTKNSNPLLSVENIEGRINPLSLLLLKLNVLFNGDLSGGRVNGSIDLFRGKSHVTAAIRDAELEYIPFFAILGIEGQGILSGDINIRNAKGTVTFAVAAAQFNPATFGGVAVPLDVFEQGRGALTVDGNALHIQSFALEGKGIYARLRGDITGGRMSLTMELMPEKTFKDQNLVFLMLRRYEVSPGYYSIPLTGPLPR
jgi:type II secretion system protein N